MRQRSAMTRDDPHRERQPQPEPPPRIRARRIAALKRLHQAGEFGRGDAGAVILDPDLKVLFGHGQGQPRCAGIFMGVFNEVRESAGQKLGIAAQLCRPVRRGIGEAGLLRFGQMRQKRAQIDRHVHPRHVHPDEPERAVGDLRDLRDVAFGRRPHIGRQAAQPQRQPRKRRANVVRQRRDHVGSALIGGGDVGLHPVDRGNQQLQVGRLWNGQRARAQIRAEAAHGLGQLAQRAHLAPDHDQRRHRHRERQQRRNRAERQPPDGAPGRAAPLDRQPVAIGQPNRNPHPRGAQPRKPPDRPRAKRGHPQLASGQSRNLRQPAPVGGECPPALAAVGRVGSDRNLHVRPAQGAQQGGPPDPRRGLDRGDDGRELFGKRKQRAPGIGLAALGQIGHHPQRLYQHDRQRDGQNDPPSQTEAGHRTPRSTVGTKTYPPLRTVLMIWAESASSCSLRRSFETCTSIARSNGPAVRPRVTSKR